MNIFIQILLLLICIYFSTTGWAIESYDGEFEGETDGALPITLTVANGKVNWEFSAWVYSPAFFCFGGLGTWRGSCEEHMWHDNVNSGTEFDCFQGSMSGTSLSGTYDQATGTWSGRFSWAHNGCSTGGGGTWIAVRPDPIVPRRIYPIVPKNVIFPVNTFLLSKAKDCNGEKGGDAVIDECGVCGGNGDTCSVGSCPNDPQTVIWQGLEWQRCDSGKKIPCYFLESDAKKYCQELVLGGYSDWRLPSWEELNTLVVCTNGHPVPLNVNGLFGQTCGTDGYSGEYSVPTIDSTFQCSESYENYCTAGQAPYSPVPAPKVIRFSDGMSNYKEGDYFVRCVRQP